MPPGDRIFARNGVRAWTPVMDASRSWKLLPGVDARTLGPGQRIIVGGRSGRKVVLLRAHDGELRCLDFACFHHGADLGAGDIVDIEDFGSALRCPAHGKCVHVATGELLEREPDGQWRSHGPVQHVHDVRTSPEGEVFVQIDTSGALPSAAYNTPQTPTASSGASGAPPAWQQRKRKATEAVCAKLSPPPTTQPQMRQHTVTGMWRSMQVERDLAAQIADAAMTDD